MVSNTGSMPDDADLTREGRDGEANSFGNGKCCSEFSGRVGNSCWLAVPLGVPLVVGLAAGAVCGGRGATCSSTLGGRRMRGCLPSKTSSRMDSSFARNAASRRSSTGTTPVPFASGAALVAMALWQPYVCFTHHARETGYKKWAKPIS